VIREQRAGRADLRAHVADRCLAGRRDRAGTRSEILDDGTSSALDAEDARNLQDDVLGCGPTGETADEAYADVLRHPEVEGPTRHHVDRVTAADTDGDHPEATRVRRMRIGSDHHAAGERVILEHDLMDDPAPGLPEAEAVLRCAGGQELVDLAI